jgi:hypothetical protein
LQPTNDFPAPFDPSNPTAFEGNHCNFTGLLIPCPDSIFNFDPFLTASGLAPGDSMWVGLSIGFGVTNTVPANGVYPLSCYGSTSVGFDVLFREPSGTDWQAGIRSAKDGPCVSVPQNTVIHVPNGEGAHCGVPLCTSASGCTLTCTLASCNASWDWLANHAPNYPALRCVRNGTSINCAQFQAGDVAFKNWLIQTAE